jgi:putative FmdB family regulatory protein
MPIYDYECRLCGNVEEVLQKLSEENPAVCTNCGADGSLKRNVGGSSFVLKGGGWHSDLYGNASKENN